MGVEKIPEHLRKMGEDPKKHSNKIYQISTREGLGEHFTSVLNAITLGMEEEAQANLSLAIKNHIINEGMGEHLEAVINKMNNAFHYGINNELAKGIQSTAGEGLGQHVSRIVDMIGSNLHASTQVILARALAAHAGRAYQNPDEMSPSMTQGIEFPPEEERGLGPNFDDLLEKMPSANQFVQKEIAQALLNHSKHKALTKTQKDAVLDVLDHELEAEAHNKLSEIFEE